MSAPQGFMEALDAKDKEIEDLRERVAQERRLVELLYRSIRAGKGKREMKEAMETVQAWLEEAPLP